MLKLSVLIGRRRETGAAFAVADAAARELDRTARKIAGEVAAVKDAAKKAKAEVVVAEAEANAGESDRVGAATKAAKNAVAVAKKAVKAATDARKSADEAREAADELNADLDVILAKSVNASGGSGNSSAVVNAYHALCSSSAEGQELRKEYGEILLIVDNQVAANPTFPDEDATELRKAKVAAVVRATEEKKVADQALMDAEAKLEMAKRVASEKASAYAHAVPGAVVENAEADVDANDPEPVLRSVEEIDVLLATAAKKPLSDADEQAELVLSLEDERAEAVKAEEFASKEE